MPFSGLVALIDSILGGLVALLSSLTGLPIPVIPGITIPNLGGVLPGSLTGVLGSILGGGGASTVAPSMTAAPGVTGGILGVPVLSGLAGNQCVLCISKPILNLGLLAAVVEALVIILLGVRSLLTGLPIPAVAGLVPPSLAGLVPTSLEMVVSSVTGILSNGGINLPVVGPVLGSGGAPSIPVVGPILSSL